MRAQDTSPIKEKILSFLEINGPSLPVHIAKYINTNMIFASAFLSELFSNKKLKISYMKVGSSPLYYLPGQEEGLEKFSQYLKPKEREAYELLKEKRYLKDKNQDPAIRVALREIKDFAFAFEKENEVFWRYLTAEKQEIPKIKETQNKIPESLIKETKIELEKREKIVKEDPKIKEDPKTIKRKISKKPSQKKNEKFFNILKEHLINKNIEILDIETFTKDNLILKIKKQNKEELLIAYNKKRLTEEDIIKANKKAEETNRRFSIISLGEPAKKTTNLIKAIRNLSEIEKIE